MTLNFDWLYWPFFRMQGVDLLSADLKTPAFNTDAGIDVADKLAKATAEGAINRIAWTGRWIEPDGGFQPLALRLKHRAERQQVIGAAHRIKVRSGRQRLGKKTPPRHPARVHGPARPPARHRSQRVLRP